MNEGAQTMKFHGKFINENGEEVAMAWGIEFLNKQAFEEYLSGIGWRAIELIETKEPFGPKKLFGWAVTAFGLIAGAFGVISLCGEILTNPVFLLVMVILGLFIFIAYRDAIAPKDRAK